MPTSSPIAGPERTGTTTKPSPPRLLLFGGKGGVGKTTCAAARAVVEARRGRRVLVLSTDPAHSLGDALAIRLSSRPSKVPSSGRRGGLWAIELNAPRAFAKWLAANRRALGEAIEHGTWLDRDDIDALLDLSLPGVDELMALVAIARLADDARYDLVVVDTAPTGHTLRLLSAPDTVQAVADVLDDLQEEHRLVRERFGRAGRPEAADRLIATIAQEARDAGALLQDRSRSGFYVVTLPEDLSIAETQDAVAALARARIPVAGIIVNRILPPGPPCPLCDPRRAGESAAVARMTRSARSAPIVRVLARVDEPRGIDALAAIGDELMTGRGGDAPVGRRHPRRPGADLRVATREGRRAQADLRVAPDGVGPEKIAAFTNARLLLFGGKGGVGKTTCAAAAAIRLAGAAHDRRVLLLSTDPAHSLGDVLKTMLDDEARPVTGGPPNLRARELDATRALASRRKHIEAAVAEITSTAAVGSRGVTELLDLAPPGIDELLGIVSVVESLGLEDASDHSQRRPTVSARGSAPASAKGYGGSAVARSASGGGKASAERPRFDLVVCDTAPTGHALRLLEMPDAARDWVQTLMRVLLKYRDVVRPGSLARELVELSHEIRRLHALLRDPGQSRFIAVTRAADVPLLETERLLARLHTLSIAVPALIVNAATLTPGTCAWCRRVAATERNRTARIRRAATRHSRACAIIQTPLVAPPPRGAARLRAWAGRWVPA